MPFIGVDVSHHQPTFDWPAYAAAGHRFGLVKATEGRTFVSPKFTPFRRAMADVGLVYRGLYHFARPETDGGGPGDAKAEAEHFVTTVGSVAPGEGLVLDYEPRAGILSKEAHEDWCVAFVDAVEADLPSIRGKILFYAPRSLVNFMSTDRLVTRCPLWVAAFGVNDGKQHPSALGLASYPGRVDRWQQPTLWQFTSRGRVAGFGGDVDLNRFDGDEAALRALAA